MKKYRHLLKSIHIQGIWTWRIELQDYLLNIILFVWN